MCGGRGSGEHTLQRKAAPGTSCTSTPVYCESPGNGGYPEALCGGEDRTVYFDQSARAGRTEFERSGGLDMESGWAWDRVCRKSEAGVWGWMRRSSLLDGPWLRKDVAIRASESLEA